jgi:gliding motility-associated lipoprotein GldH
LNLTQGTVKRDTLNCSLIERDGRVKGKGVSFYQYNFHLNDLDLRAGDSLSINIRHNMKREILPGIADVGIKLIKAGTY